MKVCVIYNGAPHYREGIFNLIEKEFDCDWFFGPGYGNIKQLPLTMFRNARILKRINLISAFYWQKGEVELLLSKKYDVFLILGESPNLSTFWGMLLHNIFNRKRKLYTWSHGLRRKLGGIRGVYSQFFNYQPYGIFVYGDYACKYMANHGFNSERLYPIHNSLNYDEQVVFRGNFSNIYVDHFHNNRPVLFFIGRLTMVKRLDLILSAMVILKKKSIFVNCVFIGDGPVRNQLEDIVKKENLMSQVWFYGPCYNEKEKSELIANADLCVAPGNIGLTAMDSLIYGTPAITMDNFGMQMPEFESIIPGVTGNFFKETKLDDLADQIAKWLNSGKSREEIRQNCYKVIDEKWNPYYQIEIIKQNLNP